MGSWHRWHGGGGGVNTRLASPAVLVAMFALAACSPSTPGPVVSSPAEAAPSTPVVTTAPGPEVTGTVPGASVDAGPSLSDPADPVALAARLDGCTLDPGVESGSWDERGFRHAECSFYAESGNPFAFVSITTWPKELTAKDAAPDLLEPRLNPDMETVIIGPGFAVEVADTTLTTLDVDELDGQVGGKVIE